MLNTGGVRETHLTERQPPVPEYVTLKDRVLRLNQILSQCPPARETIRSVWLRDESQLDSLPQDLVRQTDHWSMSDDAMAEDVMEALNMSILLFYGDDLSVSELSRMAREPVPC